MSRSKGKFYNKKLQITHESIANYFLELSIYLIASLRSIKTIKDGSDFPPDKETIEYVSKSIDKVLQVMVNDVSKFERDLNYFITHGMEKVPQIQLGDMDSFKLLARYCLYVGQLYLSFNGQVNINDYAGAITIFKDLGTATDKKAAELIAYWSAKSKRMMASKPGISAKRKNMFENIKKVKDAILKSDIVTDETIEIPIGQWTDIFEGIEIYSDTTRIKYKDYIEKELSKKINIKK